jgi:hypothetical protein
MAGRCYTDSAFGIFRPADAVIAVVARLAFLLVLVLAACGDDADKELKSARSWSATALAVGRHWTRGEVPSAYARDTLRHAADELRKGPLPAAAAPVDELVQAVDREDRAAARALLEALARE